MAKGMEDSFNTSTNIREKIKRSEVTLTPYLVQVGAGFLHYYIQKIKGKKTSSFIQVSTIGDPRKNLLEGIMDMYDIKGDVGDYLRKKDIVYLLDAKIKRLKKQRQYKAQVDFYSQID